MRPISERRKNQRGFALLVIFLMAAAVALMLYIQLPRVAFETEREKEQLLIDRGEQYKRAIQLYYVAYQRYPSKIEDLESTNDKRYLRRRYKDPFTGKDEWRLVHINGGMLTDSLVQKAPPPGIATPGSQLAGSTPSPAPPPAGATTTDPNAPPPAVNQAVLQRPSDRTLPTNNTFNQAAAQLAAPFPGAVGQANPFGITNYNDPATYPPMSLYPNGYNAPPVQQPGFNQPGFNQPGFNPPVLNAPGIIQPGLNQPGIIQPGVVPQGFPPQPIPGQQFPGQQIPGQLPAGGLPGGFVPGVQSPPVLNPNFPNQFPPNPDPNNPNNAGAGQQQFQPFQTTPLPNGSIPATPTGGMPGSAAALIQGLLTTPRQAPPGLGIGTAQPTTTGAGIAGIASTYMGPAIMSYGDRTEFEEWEFVFQPKPQQGVVSGVQGGPQGGPGGGPGGGPVPRKP